MKQEVESVKTKMQNLSTKYGQQLCTLAEDISVVSTVQHKYKHSCNQTAEHIYFSSLGSIEKI